MPVPAKQPRLKLLALATVALLSLAACKTDGAPPPGGPMPPPPPASGGKMCGGIAGFGCPSGQYCQMTPPIYPDKSGICRPRPDVCITLYKPVCGMDGKTYGNACEAAAKGASVASEGECTA